MILKDYDLLNKYRKIYTGNVYAALYRICYGNKIDSSALQDIVYYAEMCCVDTMSNDD